MESTPDPEAVKATSQLIVNDSPRALNPIPTDELIVDPNGADYIAPDYLLKTTTRAPYLESEFAELLVMLRDLNARFVGERTVDAQAMLSHTGEHEPLEDMFLEWCINYFSIRGSFDRLTPRNGNDPWQLYQACCEEFHKLLVYRLCLPGTINSSVLNLSQRYMHTCFAKQVLKSDLDSFVATGHDRFANESHRLNAHQIVTGLDREYVRFSAILDHVAKNLPPMYSPTDDADWIDIVKTKVERRAEELSSFRSISRVVNVSPSEKHQLAPNLWARLSWDVYHGGSIIAVLTSPSPEPTTERSTQHQISFRRDGWLCHREYPWIRVIPNNLTYDVRAEIAASWYILDTLTIPWYEAWDEVDSESIIARGMEEGATEGERTAAIAVVLAQPELIDEEHSAVVEKTPPPKPMKLSDFEKITTNQFQCIWSQGKGSERKVYRAGYKIFSFGRHGNDRVVYPDQISGCLRRVGIPLQDFVAACLPLSKRGKRVNVGIES